MEDLLICSVCCEGYLDGERPPVLLPRCGHSFCRPCVALLQTGGCIICPTCRTDQRIESANNLPTEFSLLAIINAQKNSQDEICSRHSVKLSFWCKTCSVATCGECLFEDHPTHSHDVIRAVQYIKDMKSLAQDIAFKFMDALDKREQHFYKNVFNYIRKISNAIRNVKILRKDMEEARNLMKGINEKESINSATSIAEAANFLGSKWNIQDVNYTKSKEDTVDEEKERESPKRRESTTKKHDFPSKPEKKDKSIVSRSKTMSVLPQLTQNEIEGNTQADNKENERNESKENRGTSEDPVLQSEPKLDEKDEELKKLDEALNSMKPRGRLARKALSAKKAELIAAAAAKEEAKNKTKEKQEKPEKSDKCDTENSTNQEHEAKDSTQNETDPKEQPESAENVQNQTNEHEEPKTTVEPESECVQEEKPPEDDSNANMAAAMDCKTMDILQIPGLEICVEGADGRLGRVEWGHDGIHIYCHQFQQLPYDILIKSSVLTTLIPSKNPTVFLEISADETTVGRIYIQLYGHLRRAHNFLTLCLGDFGFAYQSTRFLQVYNQGGPGERLLGGDYEYNNGRGGQGVIDDLEWNGDYAQPMRAGMITAAGSGQAATNSLFLLCTEGDEGRNFSCPFGMVSSGLEYVKEAIRISPVKKIWISDCGVLLKHPQIS